MAKAIDVPTFSIFAPWIDKKGWHTFAGAKNIAIHIGDYIPKEFSEMSKKEIRKETPRLYKMLKPNLFEEELKKFLDTEIFSHR